MGAWGNKCRFASLRWKMNVRGEQSNKTEKIHLQGRPQHIEKGREDAGVETMEGRLGEIWGELERKGLNILR